MKAKLEIVKLVVDTATAVNGAVVAYRDERARRAEEKRKAADEAKDRRIAELEREVERLKEKA